MSTLLNDFGRPASWLRHSLVLPLAAALLMPACGDDEPKQGPAPVADVLGDITADAGADLSENADDVANDTVADAASDTEEDSADTAVIDAGWPDWRDNLPEIAEFECPDELPAPSDARRVPGGHGYHGLAFDVDGTLLGSDGNALIRVDSEGNEELWVPGLGTIQQMQYLEPGGDLVVGTSSGLLRITPDGGRTTLAPDLNIYGVEVGPDGMVYTAGTNGVWRVNPEDGSYETLLPRTDDFLPHTVTFDREYSRILIGVVTGYFGGGDGGGGGGGGNDPLRGARSAGCNGLENGGGCLYENGQNVAVLGECVDYEGALQCYNFDFGPGGDFEAVPEQITACENQDDGASCDYENAGVAVSGDCYVWGDGVPGECWDFRFAGEEPRTALPGQIVACMQEELGGQCVYVDTEGGRVNGECFALGSDGGLQCWDPNDLEEATPEQVVACEELGEGDECAYTGFAGDVEGVCKPGPRAGDPLECVEVEEVVPPSEVIGNEIMSWAVDANLNPRGDREIYALGVGGGYHDALAHDICGNLYVSDFSTRSLWRVTPDRAVTQLIDWSSGDEAAGSYGHGWVWGTGENGWRSDAAYFPLPYSGNEVQEIVFGVPSHRWNGVGLDED